MLRQQVYGSRAGLLVQLQWVILRYMAAHKPLGGTVRHMWAL
jgi:hypothetical protein